jgi:hypothetical protein
MNDNAAAAAKFYNRPGQDSSQNITIESEDKLLGYASDLLLTVQQGGPRCIHQQRTEVEVGLGKRTIGTVR